MVKKSNTISLVLGLLLSTVSFAQTEKQFPEDYFGIYKGELKIINPSGEQSIDMEFHLTSTDTTDSYNYTLVYVVNGEAQPRNYTLKVKDRSKGEFVVDENNGIVLDAKWVGNRLYSMFEVQGNLLTTTETFYDDYMLFEITFASKTSANKSGTEGDNAVEVFSYPITTVQSARLEKQ